MKKIDIIMLVIASRSDIYDNMINNYWSIIINPKGKVGENNEYDTECTFTIYSKL